ncbi:MAG: GntR family transcriptional regulator [Candidatus Pacebacteria bacterium]|nr:GntR family transcriptional regulator [Candidatus Paceibacterota bacterium]
MSNHNSRTETNDRSREQAAYKMLVRDIYRQGLQAGDRLPTQRTLRKESSFSNFSLSRAMEKLVSDGVVERKRKVGTLVVDPTAADLSAWTVALLINWSEAQLPGPFYSRLLNVLLHGLVKAGCQCRAYIRVHHIPGTPDRLTYYASLQQDIDAGLVDGIMNVGNLAEQDRQKLAELDIPLCFSTIWQLASCGAVIDVTKFAADALSTLKEMGAKRIGVITASYHTGYEEFLVSAQETAAPIPDVVIDPIEVGETNLGGGRRAARTLMERPDDQRPDAVITMDDRIALGLTQVLRLESNYRPIVAAQTHQATPLAFALPVLHFELDDVRLAQVAIEMLIKRLKNPTLADQIVRVAPRLSGEDTACVTQTNHRDLRGISE